MPSSPRELSIAPERLTPLAGDFYLHPAPEVARALLGKALVVRGKQGWLVAEILEVEAYLGEGDPASHTFSGLSPRNRPMFDAGGACYVYLSYGINFCMNVVTGPAGLGEAVLLRAARPLRGWEEMARNRGLETRLAGLPGATPAEPRLRALLSGPGKLTQAFGLDLSYNHKRFDQPGFKLVDWGQSYSPREIGRSPRIGITKAATRLLRFFVKGSPWLSRRG